MPRLPIRLALALGLASGLWACSAVKPVLPNLLGPSPTLVTVQASASPKINLDSKKRATPVMVRIYVLKSLAAFNGADFFSLYERDQQTLADSLISKEEFMLKPGEIKLIPPFEADKAMHVGVVAAFRDIDHASWRVSTDLQAEKLNTLRISLEGDAVKISNDR